MELPPKLFRDIVRDNRGPATEFTPEKRQMGRVSLNAPATLVSIQRGGARPVVVTVCDISPTGLGVTTPEAMTKGDRFLIGLKRVDASLLWIECAVMRWQPVGSGLYFVGATFNRVVERAAAAAPMRVPAGATNPAPSPARAERSAAATPAAAPPADALLDGLNMTPPNPDAEAEEVRRIREAVLGGAG
jgi:hypothetical protein